MNLQTKISRAGLIALAIVAALISAVGFGQLAEKAQAQTASNALFVQVEASQGFASPGNSLPANFLVIVRDQSGAGVANLNQSDFTITNHFGLPGQSCGFSNNIVSFVNVGPGSYQIQIGLSSCTWVEGDYLAEVNVNDGMRLGQAPATLSLKCPVRCAPRR